MCSTFNFTSPWCQHWIFSVQNVWQKKDLWSLQWIHRHRQLLHESHPFVKFLLSFFCCSSTFCLLLLWCTAHLERCDTLNSEVTKVCFTIFTCFQQISTGFVSPSYTIQSAILHWWAFSITDTLAFPKTQISALWVPLVLPGSWGTCHTLQRRVGNGLQGFLSGRNQPTHFFWEQKSRTRCLKSWSLNIFKYNTIGNFEISNFHKLLNYTSTSLLVCPGSNGNHWLESLL